MCLDVSMGKKDHLIFPIVLPVTNQTNFKQNFFFHVAILHKCPGIFYLIFELRILITMDVIIIPTLKQILILLTKRQSLHTINKCL